MENRELDRNGQEPEKKTGHGEMQRMDNQLSDREAEIKKEEKRAEDQEFDREVARLMAAEPEGTKGKKKGKKKGSSATKKRGWKAWSKKRRALTVLAAAVVIFGAWKVLGRNKEAPVLPVSVMALQKGTVQNRLTMNGPVSGTDSADVVSNLHAEVLEVKVKEGDKVEKGQVLAIVDSNDLLKEVELAQNTYDLAVAARSEKQREAQNGYARAAQNCQTAKAALDRMTILVQGGSEPLVNLENAQNAYADALRELSSFHLVNGKPAADESYDLQIKNAAFELEKRREALENAQVKSPISGTVTRVNTKVGQFADKPENEQPMFIIENLEQLELEIKVSEYSIGKVKIGQPVTIHADILNGETVEGVVASISPTGEEKGNGSSERVIPTVVEISDKDSGLIAGITARAEILLEEVDNVLTAPSSAVMQKDDGSLCVQKVDNQVIHEIPVVLGVESDIELELVPIEEGSLQEGDSILITASPMYTEGMAVMPIPQ